MKAAVLLGTLRGSDRLAEAILAIADCDFVCLHDAVAQDLTQRGMAAVGLDQFVTEAMKREAVTEAERRLTGTAQVFQSPDFRNHWSGLPDAAWQRVATETLGMLARDMGEVIILTELIRRAAMERDIRLLVVQEDYGRDTRTAVQTCRRYGIPSLHVLHGIPYQTQAAHDVFEADIVAAHGERSREVFVTLGHDPDRIVLTGGMEWDRLCRPDVRPDRVTACSALGLDPARPVVGYATTFTHGFSAVSVRHPYYHDETSAAVFGAFATLQAAHPDWQFVIRPHPGDGGCLPRLEQMARDAGAPPLVWSTGDSVDFLAASDAVLCVQSNIGVEALLLKKPVVNVAIDAFAAGVFNEGVGSLFRPGDPVLWARTVDELAPAIAEAMTGERPVPREQWEAAMSAWCYRTEGGALDRIAELIVTMMEEPARYVRPVPRIPEFEKALALAVPDGAQTVYVQGPYAGYVAEAVRRLHTAATVVLKLDAGSPRPDVIVLTDPLPHGPGAELPLEQARTLLADGGAVVACGYHGAHREARSLLASGLWGAASRSTVPLSPAGQYSQGGMSVLLSRMDYEADAWVAIQRGGARHAARLTENVEGFAVCARRRVAAPSSYAQAQSDARDRAEAINTEGEERFLAGDLVGAIERFGKAVAEFPGLAIAHNNLGTALAAAGKPEVAYDRVVDALHFDPNLASARENLRALGEQLGIADRAERLLSLYGSD